MASEAGRVDRETNNCILKLSEHSRLLWGGCHRHERRLQEPPGWRQVSLGCTAAAAAGGIRASSGPWGLEAVAAAAVAGTPGAQGSGHSGYHDHGQGALERSELFLAFRAGAAPVLGRAGSTPYGRRGREGRGDDCGGRGGARGRGGATTPSDLNNFQFQEGKRELEKYRRCDLAEGREEAPKGSRVCGGASLDTAKTAGE